MHRQNQVFHLQLVLDDVLHDDDDDDDGDGGGDR